MLKGIRYFVVEEVGPRKGELLASSALWLSVAVGVATACSKLAGVRSEGTAVGLANVATTYSAISFGFCVSGLSLVLSCSRSEFTTRMALTLAEKRKFDALSDLIFVFSWTAVVHWILLILAFVASAIVDPEKKLITDTTSGGMLIGLGVGVGLFAYAVFEFLSVLITLSQFGRAIALDIQRTAAKKEG